jgi:hypothetical protein
VISSISLVFHLHIVIGDEAGVERIRGHRRGCHAAAEMAIWLPTPDTSRFWNRLPRKASYRSRFTGGVQLAFASLPLTSAGTHRMDKQRKSSNDGQALDEKSIRD